MEQLEERIRQRIGHQIEAQMLLAESLSKPIAQSASRLVNCLLQDNKILLCGHGGSAANCLHFSAAMLNHFDVERPPLPVIALSTDISIMSNIANEGSGELLFARQIQALGQQGDVLITLSTSGNANSIIQAISAAHDRGIDIIALNGGDGGRLADHLGPEDIELRVPDSHPALVREMHLLILHCFCDLIEQSLFGTGVM
jgi:D-sedoheptulose 7-phosphate isomerase